MYKLSNQAATDFEAIYENTLLNFGVQQADAYTADSEKILRLLGDAPTIGRNRSELANSVRSHEHRRHTICYREEGSVIFVSRMLHQRMDALRHLD